MARLLVPAVVALLSAAGWPAQAEAPSLAQPVAALPQAAVATAAVWTGEAALVFGGAEMVCYCELDQIVRFDPATGSAQRLPAPLPVAQAWIAAVWTGTEALVFLRGGVAHVDGQGLVTDWAPVPPAAFTPAAAYDGRYAYLFAADRDGRTLRYEPLARQAEMLEAVPPVAIEFAPVAQVGGAMYLFGGMTHEGYSDRIVRYDPGEERFTLLEARLPMARAGATAFTDGAYAYVLGGLAQPYDPPFLNGPVVHLSEVLRFDPLTGSVEALPVRLPFGVADASVVWTGQEAFAFGGTCECAPRFGPEHVSTDPFAMTNQLGASWMETDAIVRIVP